MLDLDTIPEDVMMFRGQYSTVRAAHEDEKKYLSKLCGELQSVPARVLKRMQPDNDAIPDSAEELINEGRGLLTLIEQCVKRIESLAQQRADLKPLAWPR